jgi:hypothetical protein
VIFLRRGVHILRSEEIRLVAAVEGSAPMHDIPCILELVMMSLCVLHPATLCWVILLISVMRYISHLIIMPGHRHFVAHNQASIMPFLRPKLSSIADGAVINVADSADDDDGSEHASPAPPLTRRRFINDDDDEVPLPSAAPSQTLHTQVPPVAAAPIPGRQPPDSGSLRAPVTSRPAGIAAPADDPHDDSDCDEGHLFEDEVHNRR